MNALAFLNAVKTLLVELTLLFSVSCNIMLFTSKYVKIQLEISSYRNSILRLSYLMGFRLNKAILWHNKTRGSVFACHLNISYQPNGLKNNACQETH
ncbi:hypothetical protein C2S08_04265 [Helicobacter pylori]|nr:hypothetical protein C2S08_04265 [Helicobacter pylori]